MPHVSLINLTPSNLARAYSQSTEQNKGKHGSEDAAEAYTFNAKEAWENYTFGHVVSENAKRIIKNLLMQTIAGTQYEKETEANDQKDDTDAEEEIQPLSLSGADFKDILNCGKLSLDGEQPEKKHFEAPSQNQFYKKNTRKHS